MTHTHYLIQDPKQRVTAWQFDKHHSIPVWVARKFHWIGAKWNGIGTHGELVQAGNGDWAVCIEERLIIVLRPAEFTLLFEKI